MKQWQIENISVILVCGDISRSASLSPWHLFTYHGCPGNWGDGRHKKCPQTSGASQTLSLTMWCCHPSNKGETKTKRRGQSKKRERKKDPRVQSLHTRPGISYACPELFLMQSALLLGARPAIVRPLFQTMVWAAKYLVWLFITRKPSPPPEECLATINIVAVMAPGVMRQRGLAERAMGLQGGWPRLSSVIPQQ